MVYVTQSTANRAPIILTPNDRAALANGGVEQVGDVDAAELSNFELGTKWTLADGRLQVEAAYVIGDWQDIPLWAQVHGAGKPRIDADWWNRCRCNVDGVGANVGDY